jgi:hypothetical protein
MANVDKARGLQPVKYLNGSPWNGKVTMYYSAGTTAIYKGTPVMHSGSASADGTTPGCAIIASGKGQMVGVAVGFSNTRYIGTDVTNLNRAYAPASTAMYVAVIDDPNVLFEIQEDNGGSAYIEVADVGQFFPIATHSAGSTTTGYSTAELDSDGNTATAASAAVQLVGLVDRVDNEMGSSAAYAKWLVRPVIHPYNAETVAV